MDLKAKIEESEKKLQRLRKELEVKEAEVENAKMDERHASNNSTLGLAMMTNSVTRPMGTYSYLKNSGDAMSFRSTIFQLERDCESLRFEIFEEERRKKGYEEELEFQNRPEARLVDSEEGIFIEGDSSRTNLLYQVQFLLERYVEQYRMILDSEPVREYCELMDKIMQSPEFAALTDSTSASMRDMERLVKYYVFKYLVIGNKVVVDTDFVRNEIQDAEDMIKYYNRKLKEQEEKLTEDFQATGLGRAFPSIRKKQEAEFKGEVQSEIDAIKRRIDYGRGEIASYQKIREKYILPSEPFFKQVRKIRELKEDYPIIYRFENEADDYRTNIENHTILKSSLDGDFFVKMIIAVKPILDKMGVKITREQILELIFNSEYHAELAEELKNAGYKLEQRGSERVSKPVELGE